MVINQAITGMGGLGKTQLAVEFAYRYGKYFQGVHWLNLADPTTLDSEIALCGSKMGFANWPADQPSQVTMTELEWKRNGPRLLILDNFEDIAQSRAVLSKFHHSNLRLLVTSRRSDWPTATSLSSLPLELFSPRESLDFLRESLKKRNDKEEDLIVLAERLGNLPLGLELASRYLNDHPRLSIADYLTKTKEAFEHPSMRDWRKDLPVPTNHDLDLQHTFVLSWQSVKDEIAQKIFMMAGYLAPNVPIPLEIFETALEISVELCDESLSILYGLGLLGMTESNEPVIHPLLTEFARRLAGENNGIFDLLTNAMGHLTNKANQTGLPARFVPLSVHLPAIAAEAARAKMPISALLWNEYGYYLTMIANYSGASVAFERALKIDEVAFGPDHPNVAIRVINLGTVLREQGDFEGARAAFERALSLIEAGLGPDHPNAATCVSNLGLVLKEQGDLEGARAAFERALKIDEAAFGPDHPNVAIRINNLGLVMHKQGNFKDASAMFSRALQIWENGLAPNHPKVALALNNLGDTLRLTSDFTGARAAFERAIRIWQSTLGPDHPDHAMTINNLGLVMYQQGEIDDARGAFEHALKILEKLLSPDHPNIRIVQGNLDFLNKHRSDE